MIRGLASTLVLVLVLALGAGAALAAQPSGEVVNDESMVPAEVVHLRGLDNLTGTSVDLTVRVGAELRFGELRIDAEACRVPRADPLADAEAFLRIQDVREAAPRFSGWMFASSPALSALDHPRYDVWVTSCSNS